MASVLTHVHTFVLPHLLAALYLCLLNTSETTGIPWAV